jgi:hypothetical protein
MSEGNNGKKYETCSTYQVLGARLAKDAEAGETKAGEKTIKLTTVEQGYAEDVTFVTWILRSKSEDYMEKALKLRKGDVLSAVGKPQLYISKNGKVNMNVYVGPRELSFSSAIVFSKDTATPAT